MKNYVKVALLGASMAAALPASAANLLVNGGFEAAPVGVNLVANVNAPLGMVQQYPSAIYTHQYLSGWTMSNPGESNLARGPYNYSLYPTLAYEGSQFLSLNWSPLGNVTLENTISQGFAMASAGRIDFSAAMAVESGFTGSSLQVSILNAAGGIVAQSGLLTHNAGNALWALQSWNTNLDAGSYTLALRGLGAGNAWDVLLDDVRLEATASPTPEPASWAMLLGGFGAIGGAMRYRRRKPAFAA